MPLLLAVAVVFGIQREVQKNMRPLTAGSVPLLPLSSKESLSEVPPRDELFAPVPSVDKTQCRQSTGWDFLCFKSISASGLEAQGIETIRFPFITILLQLLMGKLHFMQVQGLCQTNPLTEASMAQHGLLITHLCLFSVFHLTLVLSTPGNFNSSILLPPSHPRSQGFLTSWLAPWLSWLWWTMSCHLGCSAGLLTVCPLGYRRSTLLDCPLSFIRGSYLDVLLCGSQFLLHHCSLLALNFHKGQVWSGEGWTFLDWWIRLGGRKGYEKSVLNVIPS